MVDRKADPNTVVSSMVQVSASRPMMEKNNVDIGAITCVSAEYLGDPWMKATGSWRLGVVGGSKVLNFNHFPNVHPLREKAAESQLQIGVLEQFLVFFYYALDVGVYIL